QLRLRRRTEKFKITIVEIKQVRRWIDRPQRPVNIEFVTGKCYRKCSRRHDLKNIATLYMFLHLHNQRFELFVGHIGTFLALALETIFREVFILIKVFQTLHITLLSIQKVFKEIQLVAEMIYRDDVFVNMIL